MESLAREPMGGRSLNATPSKDSIGSPRLRRLWGPGGPNAFDTSPSTLSARVRPSPPKPPRSGEYSSPGALHGLTPRLEATGSLLPQASPEKFTLGPLSAREHSSAGKFEGKQFEVSYNASTIRKLHAMVLQSGLDLNFGQALERVCNAAKALTKCKHAQIFFLEKMEVQPGGLSSTVNYSLRMKGKGTQDKLFPCEGLAGVCAQENTALLCNRPHHDARFNPDIDWAPGAGVKTVACAPMTNLAGKVVGVIQCSNKSLGGFSEEDLFFLEFLGRQAAVTLDLSIKNEARQAQQRKTAAMLKGCIKLAGKPTVSELSHKAGLLCKEVCGASQACCFMLQDGETSLTSWTKLVDGKAEVFTEKRVPLKGFLSEVLRSAAQDAEASQVRQHLGSLYAPIIAHGKPIGIIQARGNRKGQFSEVDEQMVAGMCSIVGVLRENITRSLTAINADHGREWPSISDAVVSVQAQMASAVHAQHVRLLIFEQDTGGFWTPGKEEGSYLRFPAEFPLGYVCEHKSLFHYPARGAPVSEHEAFEIRACAHRFMSKSTPVEALLLVPLMAGDTLLGVILIINKVNASGPFDASTEKVAVTLSTPWGRRLEATLRDEATKRQLLKLHLTFKKLPAIATAESYEECLIAIGDYVTSLLRSEKCWVMLPDKSNQMRVVLASGAEPLLVPALDSGLAGLSWTTGEPHITHDAKEDKRCTGWLADRSRYDIRTVLCAPVWSAPRENGGKVIAVLQVMNKLGEADVFADKHAALLTEFCPLAAVLMDNAMSLLELRQFKASAKSALQHRNVVVQEIATLHTFEDDRQSPSLLFRVKRMARTVLQAQDCVIFVTAGKRKMYELQDNLRGDSFFEPWAGVVGHVIAKKTAMIHSADNPHEKYDPEVDGRTPFTATSILCVPLTESDGVVIGAIELINCLRSPGQAFSEDDAELLLNLGKHVTAALRSNLSVAKRMELNEKIASIPPHITSKHHRIAYLESVLARVVTAERVNLFVRHKNHLSAIDSGTEIIIRMDQGYVGRCARAKTTVHILQLAKDSKYLPAVDGRPAITIDHALFVPILDGVGDVFMVIELLNKKAGPFDTSDELLCSMVGTSARDIVTKFNDTASIEDARVRALAMLTSIQYLYPTSPDVTPDAIIFAALAQVRVLLRAKPKLYLCIPSEGQLQEHMWRCYEEPSSILIVPVASFAGSSLVKVAPVVVSTQELDSVRREEGGEAEEEAAVRIPVDPPADERSDQDAPDTAITAPGPGQQTSAFLCQPLMDAVGQKPIGVIEFRRSQTDSIDPIESFTSWDQELAQHISTLLVASMVHYAKTRPAPTDEGRADSDDD